jgi:hypothetical protein
VHARAGGCCVQIDAATVRVMKTRKSLRQAVCLHAHAGGWLLMRAPAKLLRAMCAD